MENENLKEIRVWDMGDQTLFYADVLELIVKKFNIKKINRGKIVFSSLKELENFPIPIDTSTIFLFDVEEYKEIDLSKIKLEGASNIICSTSFERYASTKKFDNHFFFTSVLNCGEALLSRINNNLNSKEFYFYHSNAKKMNEYQSNTTLKVPATLIWQ